jgi:radical SAM-linked protein
MRDPTGSERAAMTTASKLRLRFAKRGDLRLISHHDLLRCLERMLRRAQIPMAHSQGFNPRPKIVFTLALGLGIEGCREVVELELGEPLDADEVLQRLRAAAPPGFEWLEAQAVPPGPAAQPDHVAYALPVPADLHDAVRERLQAFLNAAEWPYTRRRPDRTTVVDLRPFILEAELDTPGLLRFRMKMLPSGSARPEELIDALGLRDLLGRGAVLSRTDVELIH